MTTVVRIEGLEALKERFANLPKELGRKTIRSIAMAGAGVMRTAARQTAPQYLGRPRKGRTPGTLKRAAIAKRVAANSSDTQAQYVVTFRRGKKQQTAKGGSRDAFYASWVEFGHKVVARSRKVKTLLGKRRNARTLQARRESVSKQVEGVHYLANAFRANGQRALKAMEKAAIRAIQRIDNGGQVR